MCIRKLRIVHRIALIGVMISAGYSDGAGSDIKNANEILLREMNMSTDGPSLVAFLRDHSATAADPQQIPELIRKLASRDLNSREQAVRDLTALAHKALPALEKAEGDPDADVARGVKLCMERINRAPPLEKVSAVLNLLVDGRTPGATEALLRYLPYAPERAIEEQICFGLYELAKGQQALEPALTAALRDPLPARRAVAACIVGRLGTGQEHARVRELMTDRDPEVQLRAAQGLLASKEHIAIPTLVALLTTAPSVELAWQAEELLHWAAGGEGPRVTLGVGSAQSRRVCRAAWQEWWQNGGAKLKLGSDRRPLLLLRCSATINNERRLSLCGHDGKPRWELGGLSAQLTSFSLLPNDRLLLSEDRSRTIKLDPNVRMEYGPVIGVTERDLQGKILWQYKGIDYPLACRRLPDGKTLVVGNSGRVALVSAKGETVSRWQTSWIGDEWSIPRPCLLWDGRLLLCQTTDGLIKTLIALNLVMYPDPRAGLPVRVEGHPPRGPGEMRIHVHDLAKTRKGVTVQTRLLYRSATIDLLPTGNYLIRSPLERCLCEIDGTGKTTWRFELGDNPAWAIRLPDGRTLVAFRNLKGEGQLSEISGAGFGVIQRNLAVGQFRLCLSLVSLGFDFPSTR